jgi:hypothetical protein
VTHPEYPFWCLQNKEALSEVSGDKSISLEPGELPIRAALIRTHARGGFLPEVYEALRNSVVHAQVVADLLFANFRKT